jgi:predicted amidohydrolase
MADDFFDVSRFDEGSSSYNPLPLADMSALDEARSLIVDMHAEVTRAASDAASLSDAQPGAGPAVDSGLEGGVDLLSLMDGQNEASSFTVFESARSAAQPVSAASSGSASGSASATAAAASAEPQLHAPSAEGVQSDADFSAAVQIQLRAALPPAVREMCEEGLDIVRASLGLPPLSPSALQRRGDSASSAATGTERGSADSSENAAEPHSSPTTVASSSASSAHIPSSLMRIAVAQVHSVPSEPWRNVSIVRRVLQALQHAKGNNSTEGTAADLLVFPELFMTGYHLPTATMQRLAMRADVKEGQEGQGGQGGQGGDGSSSPLAAVAALARKHATAVCVGYPEASFDDQGRSIVYNSLILFDIDGSVCCSYRKAHLWGPFERAAFAPGNTPYKPALLKAFPHTPVGLLVCFDMEFPEPSRALATHSAAPGAARVIVASVAMGERRAFASRVFARARACENNVAFVYANFPSSPPPPFVPDTEDDTVSGSAVDAAPLPSAPASSPHYSGGSSAIAPDGTTLHQLPAYVFESSTEATLPGESSKHYPSETNRRIAAFLGSAEADVSGALRIPVQPAADSNSSDEEAPRLGPDEHVFVVHFDAEDPQYVGYAQRNPYLQQRRADLLLAS